MKKITPLLLAIFLFSVGAKAQTTFNYNGPGDTVGSVQFFTLAACATQITITIAGATGGDADYTNGMVYGGRGAVLTGTIPVTGGHQLAIVVGDTGGWGSVDGGGGGGASYVWDNTSNTLLAVAGGGGGAGDTANAPNAQTTNTSAAALEAVVPSHGSGAGGVGGNGGAAGALPADGNACGGGGWISNGKNIGNAATYFYVGYGRYPKDPTYPAYGGNGYGGAYSFGAYGGGAGGGFNGGGGAGGYNGGGGGSGTATDYGYAGQGGGSYFNGTTATSTSLNGATVGAMKNGYVIITPNCALPIQLLYFNCKQGDNAMNIEWATASEENSSHFTLYRSQDGIQYMPVTTLAAGGNTTETRNYSYTDANAFEGINYYKLEETDIDGAVTNYGISTSYFITLGGIYPNPNHGTFNFTLLPADYSQTVVITDLNGKQVYNRQYDASPTRQSYSITMPQLNGGVFIVKVLNSSGQVLTVKKLIVY